VLNKLTHLSYTNSLSTISLLRVNYIPQRGQAVTLYNLKQAQVILSTPRNLSQRIVYNSRRMPRTKVTHPSEETSRFVSASPYRSLVLSSKCQGNSSISPFWYSPCSSSPIQFPVASHQQSADGVARPHSVTEGVHPGKPDSPPTRRSAVQAHAAGLDQRRCVVPFRAALLVLNGLDQVFLSTSSFFN